MLDVCLLGTGGMMPLPERFLTSLITRLNGHMLLIDCGEGTQVTMKLLGWGFKSIDVICFTHFHADHISGLPGLLLTIGNSGREEPIDIIGPKGIANILHGLLVIAPELPFEIMVTELPDEKVCGMELRGFHIDVLPVEHGIRCFAYALNVRRAGKFDKDKADKLPIPKKLWGHLQRGESVTYEGEEYHPRMVMGPSRQGIKVCYCTDSRPTKAMPDFFKNSDLLVCEGIYGEIEKLPKAIDHRHMIFQEAAELAQEAGVGELWLTHYSPAMPNPNEYLPNAKNIFKNTVVAYDRITKKIVFLEGED